MVRGLYPIQKTYVYVIPLQPVPTLLCKMSKYFVAYSTIQWIMHNLNGDEVIESHRRATDLVTGLLYAIEMERGLC